MRLPVAVLLVGSLAVALFVTPANAKRRPAPAKLPELAVKHDGKGAHIVVFANGVELGTLLHDVSFDGYLVVADQKTITGTVSAPGAPWDDVVDALAQGVELVKPPVAHGAKLVDLEFRGVPARDVLRLLAETVNADYVIAPSHELPKLTMRLKGVDAIALAKVIARLAGLDLVPVKGRAMWVLIDAGTKLDAKLLAKSGKERIDLRGATPGEARRLLDPTIADEDAVCPAGVSIDATIRHGGVGALDAVLAMYRKPACEPASGELNDTSTLVGTLAGKRAIFRLGHGAKVYEPTAKQGKVGNNWVELDHTTITLTPAIVAAPPPPTGPFIDKDGPTHWKLRAVVGWLGPDSTEARTWRAIFVSDSGSVSYVKPGGQGLDMPKIEIDATHAWTTDRSYALSQ